MEILHINTSDKHGGAENMAYSLMQEFGGKMFVKNKYRKDNNIGVFRRKFISYLLEGIDSFLYRLFKRTLFSDMGVIKNIHGTWKFLKNHPWYKEADCILLHNLHGGYFDLHTLEQISLEKKVVWVLHDMWSMTGGEAHTFGNENFKKGIPETPYNNLYPLKSPIYDFRKSFLNHKKKIYKNSPAITYVAVSNWIANDFNSSYTAHKLMNIKVIRNGIDTSLFYNLNKRNSKIPVTIFFNSDNPFKGGHLFKSIAPHVTGEYKLITIGEKIEGVKNQRTVSPTYVPSEMNELFNQADILVFPSKMEALGLVALEAMATGCVVIGGNNAGSKETIEENHGFLFENGHEKSLQEVFEKVIEYPIQKINHLGKLNEKNIQENWSKESMLARYHSLLS